MKLSGAVQLGLGLLALGAAYILAEAYTGASGSGEGALRHITAASGFFGSPAPPKPKPAATPPASKKTPAPTP